MIFEKNAGVYYALTAYHVVSDGDENTKFLIQPYTAPSFSEYTDTVLEYYNFRFDIDCSHKNKYHSTITKDGGSGWNGVDNGVYNRLSGRTYEYQPSLFPSTFTAHLSSLMRSL